MLWRTVEDSSRFHSMGNFIDLSNKTFCEKIISISKEKAELLAYIAVFTCPV